MLFHVDGVFLGAADGLAGGNGDILIGDHAIQTGIGLHNGILHQDGIADDSALADYMATELTLSDYEVGRALCKKMGIEAIWVTYTGEIMYTDGYAEYSLNFSK